MDVNRNWTKNFRSYSDYWDAHGVITDGTVFLDLHSQYGDTLPPLQELRILSKQYELLLSHCTELRKCMDWSKLKTLELKGRFPQAFFVEFRGCILNPFP